MVSRKWDSGGFPFRVRESVRTGVEECVEYKSAKEKENQLEVHPEV
jgi:hypothetical protein